MIKRFLFLVSIPFVIALALKADEPVKPVWKLAKGDRLILVNEHEIETISKSVNLENNQEQTDEEREISKVEFILETLDVRENGNMNLEARIDNYSRKSISKARTLSFKGTRGKDGKPVISIEIDTQNELMKSKSVQDLFTDMITRLMEMRVKIEIDPQGRVISHAINKDILADISGTDKITRFAAQLIKKLLKPEDITSGITAELFTQLPDKAVSTGESWPVHRTFHLLGMKGEGKGSAQIEELFSKNGTAYSKIKEDISFSIDTEEFSRLMEETMEEMLAGLMGMKMEVIFAINPANNLKYSAESIFNLDQGFTESTYSSNINFPLNGKLTVKLMGKEVVQDLTMNVTVNSKSSCKKN